MVENKEHFLDQWKVEDGDELGKYKIRKFIRVMKDGVGTKEFDTNLCLKIIKKMLVFKDKKIVVSFLDWTEVKCIIE